MSKPQDRKAFTVIELMVVTFIIGLMAALTLSAVQSAREAGRRITCQNNLKNQSLAALQCLDAHNHFPSGGWGGWWVGVPGRGAGRNQPGGWVFILLPYVERGDLLERGQALPPAELPDYMARLIQVPQKIFNCPSRRPAYLYSVFYDYAAEPRGAAMVHQVARSDYAANAGDQPRSEFQGWWGPQTLADGDHPQFHWPDTSTHTGVSYLRSQVAAAEVRDGLSRTYLCAEKYLSTRHYNSGEDHGQSPHPKGCQQIRPKYETDVPPVSYQRTDCCS